MLAVTGHGSNVVTELLEMVPEEEVVRMRPPYSGHLDAERYLLCAGVIRPKTLREQTAEEITETLNVNCIWPITVMDRILDANDAARICVIGSESGFTWSYDGAYAAAKAALHKYVETKKLEQNQQLVCIAPSIISDTGMTQARADTGNLERRKSEHPKGRFLKAVEVARLVKFLLYDDLGYITGQVIRMNGGPSSFCSRRP